MKIKKNYLLEKVMFEDTDPDETTLDELDPAAASEADIEDALEDTVDDATDGEAELSNAKAVARDIMRSAREIDAGGLSFDPNVFEDPDAAYTVENKLTKMLDWSLRKARAVKSSDKNKTPHGVNILIEGLPGSGKTSIVGEWTRSRGLNLYSITAHGDIESKVYGAQLRDLRATVDNPNKLINARSSFLDPLFRRNTILFIDEYNRADDESRQLLMKLVDEHEIPIKDDETGEEDMLRFPELLFCIAAQNPAAGEIDPSAHDISPAERRRFVRTTFNSNVATARDYFKKRWNKELKHLSPKNPDYDYWLEYNLRCEDLGNFIVNHKDFRFDNMNDYQQVFDQNKTELSMASLTDVLERADGDVDIILTELNDALIDDPDEKESTVGEINWLEKDITMMQNILAEYKRPSLQELINKKKEENANLINDEKADAAAKAAQARDEENGIVNHDEMSSLFDNNANGKVAPPAANVASQINDLAKGWGV